LIWALALLESCDPMAYSFSQFSRPATTEIVYLIFSEKGVFLAFYVCIQSFLGMTFLWPLKKDILSKEIYSSGNYLFSWTRKNYETLCANIKYMDVQQDMFQKIF
jgi:hypothetical protein